jgi:hypothetical protein
MPVICPTAQGMLEKICNGASATQVQLKMKVQLKMRFQLKKPAAVAPARASIFPTMRLCH